MPVESVSSQNLEVTFEKIKTHCNNIIDTMPLDITKSREAMLAIHTVRWFGEYSIPLENRPRICVLKTVLHDTWSAIEFQEGYAIQIGLVNADLALFLMNDRQSTQN